MTWVNLNDVYVPKTGGTITGGLTVNGNLTINDGTGNGTTYNVANEITSLRDSVSQVNGWTVFKAGKLRICIYNQFAANDNANISNAWGNSIIESAEITLPDYPVTFTSKPWLNVLVTDADPGTEYASLAIEYTYKLQTATSPGSICLTRPAGSAAIVGHPVLNIMAVGLVS